MELNKLSVTKDCIQEGVYTIYHWKDYSHANRYFIECYEGAYRVFQSIHAESRHIKTLRKVKMLYTSTGKEFNENFSGEVKDYHG